MIKARVGVGVDHVLAVEQPGEFVHHAAIASAPATKAASPAAAANEQQKDDPAPIAAETTKAVIVAAVGHSAISWSDRHRNIEAAFISKSHFS